jgi:hypothetical protein
MENKIAYIFAETAISEIEEAEINPQQMKQSEYNRLVKSIRKDKALTSTVLLMKQNGTDKFRCISGHHRIKAARSAGLQRVPAMIIDEVDKSTRTRLQLTHNDIHGEPDMNIAELLLSDIQWQDLELIGEYEGKQETQTQWENAIDEVSYQYVNICLMPESAGALKTLIAVTDENEVENLLIGKEDYQRMMELLTQAHRKGYKTPGQAFRAFLDVIEKYGIEKK